MRMPPFSRCLLVLLLSLSAARPYAQGSFFTSLSGTVTDASGAVIPGGNGADSFRMTSLLGDNQARIVQLIWRVRW